MNAQLKQHSDDWDSLTGNQQEWVRCATDPHYFINRYVYTFDEVDGAEKLYPDLV